MNPPPRQTTTRHHQRIGLVWLLSALLTLVGVYSGYRLYLAHKVKVKIGQIRQAGLPVTTAELNKWYAAVPPDENAALILTNAFAHLVKVNTNTPNLPIIGRGKLPPRNEPLSPEMSQAIADYVATNQMALELLEKGLALKSCRYPVDLTPSWDALLPHLVGLKKSAQLLALKALSEIENGERAQAAESLQRMLTLADTVANEPLLISHLVRISCYRISYPCLERILCRGSLQDDSLLRFLSLFKNMDESDGFLRALVEHRCNGLQCFDYSLTQFQKFLDESGNSDAHDFGVVLGFWTMRISGHWQFDELFFLDCFDQYSSAIVLPFTARLDSFQQINDGVERMKRKKYPYILSGMILPSFARAFQKDTVHIAYLRAAQAALAIERYRKAHNSRLPEMLRETVPGFSKEVPADPFNGELIHYKHLGKGYIVYSVGPDREDNGGAEEKTLSNAQRLAGISEPSDITFTVVR